MLPVKTGLKTTMSPGPACYRPWPPDRAGLVLVAGFLPRPPRPGLPRSPPRPSAGEPLPFGGLPPAARCPPRPGADPEVTGRSPVATSSRLGPGTAFLPKTQLSGGTSVPSPAVRPLTPSPPTLPLPPSVLRHAAEDPPPRLIPFYL